VSLRLFVCRDVYESDQRLRSLRGDLALMYLVELDTHCGNVSVQPIPMHIRRFRLEHASAADARLLCYLLCHLGRRFGTKARLKENNSLTLEWRLE
jgi:hypothetical protein